jgi:hypothetical protein
MDGKTAIYQLADLLQEGTTSTFMENKLSYDVIYEAVCALNQELKLMTATQDITTVASTRVYDINANFLCLDVTNDDNEFVAKYYDTANYNWITYREQNQCYQDNNTSDQSIPNYFSIVDESSLPTNITGTATSDSSASGGECTLTDSTAPFTSATVQAGDLIHNTTDGSYGVVVEYTSTSAIKTALFGGTNNDWTSSDAYVLVPQTRRQIYIDPPSLTAGHTITLKYICKPDPVYSSYRSYRIPSHYMPAVIKYAAWLYKYRDREPNFGDGWYKYWDMELRKYKANERRMPDHNRFRVNMKKNSNGYKSAR